MQKSSKTKKACLLFSSCFLFSSATIAAHIDVPSKQIELETVTNQIELLQKDLHEDQTEQTDLIEALKMLELSLPNLNKEIEKLNGDLASEQAELAKLKKTQQTLTTQLTNQRHALTHQLLTMYQLGKMQALKGILNPDNLNTINRHLYYYHYLSEARSKLVAEVKSTLTILNNNLADISQHERNLRNLLQAKQLQQKRANLAELKRSRVVTQLGQASQTKQQQLVILKNNQKALQDMLDTLKPEEASMPNNLPFDQLHGKLEWPLTGTLSTLTNDVNNPHHGGIVIHAAEGTPVHAIYAGKVIFANWLRGFGLLVIINHGNGFMSLYARNQAIYTKVGAEINTRDVISAIGNSGGYQKPSLYFEIRHNGSPVNANQWCHI